MNQSKFSPNTLSKSFINSKELDPKGACYSIIELQSALIDLDKIQAHLEIIVQ